MYLMMILSLILTNLTPLRSIGMEKIFIFLNKRGLNSSKNIISDNNQITGIAKIENTIHSILPLFELVIEC